MFMYNLHERLLLHWQQSLMDYQRTAYIVFSEDHLFIIVILSFGHIQGIRNCTL